MTLSPSKYLKFLIFVKLLIQRYQFIGITLSKPHLECTFYDKQINVKKYEWKFGSVQTLLVGDCITQIIALKAHPISSTCYNFLQSLECIALPHFNTIQKQYSSFGLDNEFTTYLNEILYNKKYITL